MRNLFTYIQSRLQNSMAATASTATASQPQADGHIEIDGNLYKIEAFIEAYTAELEKLKEEASKRVTDPANISRALLSNSEAMRRISQSIANELSSSGIKQSITSACTDDPGFVESIVGIFSDRVDSQVASRGDRIVERIKTEAVPQVVAEVQSTFATRVTRAESINNLTKALLSSLLSESIQEQVKQEVESQLTPITAQLESIRAQTTAFESALDRLTAALEAQYSSEPADQSSADETAPAE